MDQLPNLEDTVSKLSTHHFWDRDRTKAVDSELNSDQSGFLCKESRSSRDKFPTGACDREGCGLKGEKEKNQG